MYDDGWGPWTFDPSNYTLRHPKYEVDLERCTSSAEVLDWIFQVGMKTWCDSSTLVGLINALQDTILPQQYLCSWGRDLRLSPEMIRTMTSSGTSRLTGQRFPVFQEA